MTELKHSFCEAEPPMVEAQLAPADAVEEVATDLLQVDATSIEEYEADGDIVEEDIPVLPSDEEQRAKERVIGAGVASGVLGL